MIDVGADAGPASACLVVPARLLLGRAAALAQLGRTT